MGKYVFGVDVGGTTVKLGLFDVEGNLLDKWEIPTRTENGGENILPDVAESIKKKMEEKDILKNHPELKPCHTQYLIHSRRQRIDVKYGCSLILKGLQH